MAAETSARMFGEVPLGLFHTHNWRRDVETVGQVPAEFIFQQSEGKRLAGRGHSHGTAWRVRLLLSIAQVVPHEVIGMANYNKNILIGAGGRESINRSHCLRALYAWSRFMGCAQSPVRSVLNYAAEHFHCHIPIVYVLTVIGKKSVVRGLFIGGNIECFR
jgi:nickel-dependent lactate racemase